MATILAAIQDDKNINRVVLLIKLDSGGEVNPSVNKSLVDSTGSAKKYLEILEIAQGLAPNMNVTPKPSDTPETLKYLIGIRTD